MGNENGVGLALCNSDCDGLGRWIDGYRWEDGFWSGDGWMGV